MKRSITALVAAAALTTAAPALAADWTGFYGGAQIGFADVDANVPGVGGDGMIGGIIAGYDWDFGQWVAGAGFDYDFTDITIAGPTKVESVWRAKLRGGYKFGDGLLYGTAGYAVADTNTLGDEDGYFVGLGYDYLVTPNFSLGGEVLYHEFDNFGPTTVDVDATTLQLRGAFRF